MKNNRFLLQLLLAATVSLVAMQGPSAAAADKPKTAAEDAKPKRDWYPFHGDVDSVSKTANTITLKKQGGERVLRLDAKTELNKGGKTVTVADIKPGEYAHGKVHKDTEGREVILAAKFEPPAPASKKAEPLPKKPEAPAKTN